MRRRSDSWLNATQLLKVAGIDKGRRTKILDKDIAAGNRMPFEKVQGGYGRYQGTWIPFHCGKDLAEQYGVLSLIQPLLDYQAAPPAPPLAGLGQASPSGSSMTIDSNQPIPQGNIAYPQQQRAQQQAQLSQAQQIPLPITRVNGISALNAAAASAEEETAAAAALGQTGRKRLRQHANANHNNIKEQDDLDSQESFSTTQKRPRMEQLADSSNSQSAYLHNLHNNEIAFSKSVNPQSSPSSLSFHIKKASKFPNSASINLEHRNLLMSLFISDPSNSSSPTHSSAEADPALAISSFPPDLDHDTPIDDQLHTALHWAAALARIPTVRSLISLGADPSRGNATGETPLMRAVLVTNNFDTETFAPPNLISSLYPSLRTVDDAERTALHHIALVAGIKGRSVSARHYMEAILHWVAEKEDSNLAQLVDAQDRNGDTALSIAARVGSRPIVRMLLESGADARIPNKLDLRAGDFGLLEEGLTLPTPKELVLEQMKSPSTLKSSAGATSLQASQAQKSLDVLPTITALLSTVSSDFSIELSSRSDSLDRTRAQLHLATKELADQRQTISVLRDTVKQVELSKWRIRNLERALADEDKFDWTGRSSKDGQPAFPPSETSTTSSSGKDKAAASFEAIQRSAFEYRGVSSTLGTLQAVSMPTTISADPRDPTSADEGKSAPPHSQLTLAQIRRMTIWYERVLSVLRERIETVRGNSGEVELNARKVVKLCTGVESDEEVEDMLANLITALESDGGQSTSLDLQR